MDAGCLWAAPLRAQTATESKSLLGSGLSRRRTVMLQRLFAALNILAAALVAAFLIPGPDARQTAQPKAPAKSYAAPGTPDGQPDMQGIWSNAVVTPLERPADLKDQAFFTKEEAAAYV